MDEDRQRKPAKTKSGNSDREYAVGYGRPPREHQFKAGEPSRNPKGRPKGQLRRLTLASVRASFLKAAEEPITIRIDGKTLMVSRTEAIIHPIYADALKGDPKAIKTYFELLQMFERQGAAIDKQEEQERLKSIGNVSLLTQEERNQLRSLAEKMLGKTKKKEE